MTKLSAVVHPGGAASKGMPQVLQTLGAVLLSALSVAVACKLSRNCRSALLYTSCLIPQQLERLSSTLVEHLLIELIRAILAWPILLARTWPGSMQEGGVVGNMSRRILRFDLLHDVQPIFALEFCTALKKNKEQDWETLNDTTRPR